MSMHIKHHAYFINPFTWKYTDVLLLDMMLQLHVASVNKPTSHMNLSFN